MSEASTLVRDKGLRGTAILLWLASPVVMITVGRLTLVPIEALLLLGYSLFAAGGFALSRSGSTIAWPPVLRLGLAPLWLATPLVLGRLVDVASALLELALLLPSFLLAAGALALAVVSSLMPSRRHEGIRQLGLAVLLILSCLTTGALLGQLRMRSIDRIAHRAGPILGAIEKYREDHGSPPNELPQLVPHYLEELPGTGLSRFPEFEYDWPVRDATGKSNYELYTYTAEFGINFDRYSYIPSGAYPERHSGFWELRDTGWAYFHE